MSRVEMKEIRQVFSQPILCGRPRKTVDYGLLLALREEEGFGWERVANEYTNQTGDFISKQTCKRRYLEAKLNVKK